MIITVDCGTTNMRVRLFKEKKLIDEVKKRAGIRNSAFDGSSDILRSSLRDAVSKLLERNRLAESDVEVILAAGTLTSNVGIYRVPHVKAPAGPAESADGAKMVVLEDISGIPILFIPGVRTAPADEEGDPVRRIELLESMSSEECETYGTMSLLGIKGDIVITLPGSHVETIEVDGDGRIVSIATGMCGELIAALSEHTLLCDSLPSPPIRAVIREKLIEGYEYCLTHGVSSSIFKTRMVTVWSDWSEDEAANFFVGATLADDVRMTKSIYKCGKRLVLGGGEPLREIFRILLLHAGVDEDDLTVVDDETAGLSTSYGAMRVYEIYKDTVGAKR